MGRLRPSHLVEAGLWLLAAAVLFALSFKFNQDIEIYKFGASAWPRALILLMVIGALGQLYWQYRFGDAAQNETSESASDATEAASENTGVKWYLHTAAMIALPFVYMRVPEWIGQLASISNDDLGPVKLIVGALVIGLFAYMARSNRVGGMLGLPLMFAAMLQDFGFYAMAPLFMLAVMWLMGERRWRPMVIIMVILFGLLMTLFVKVLYVGLPTGNIEPFYSFGNWVVKILQ